MIPWFPQYEIVVLALVIAVAVSALILFGFWLGRMTKTNMPMGAQRVHDFDPGPIGAEKSELDDAFYTPTDYEGEE